MAVSDWSTTPGSNNAAPPNGAPEGWAPGDVNAWGRQVMADVRSLYDEVAKVTQNLQSGNYTLVLSDKNKDVTHPSGGGAGDTYTIPANASVAYDIGTIIQITNLDSNSITIAITTDTLTLAGTTSTGSRTLGQNGVATIKKVTATSWLIWGVSVF
jgi:hypothetical protein